MHCLDLHGYYLSPNEVQEGSHGSAQHVRMAMLSSRRGEEPRLEHVMYVEGVAHIDLSLDAISQISRLCWLPGQA